MKSNGAFGNGPSGSAPERSSRPSRGSQVTLIRPRLRSLCWIIGLSFVAGVGSGASTGIYTIQELEPRSGESGQVDCKVHFCRVGRVFEPHHLGGRGAFRWASKTRPTLRENPPTTDFAILLESGRCAKHSGNGLKFKPGDEVS